MRRPAGGIVRQKAGGFGAPRALNLTFVKCTESNPRRFGRPGAFPVKLHVKLAPHPAPGRALRQISILKLAARSGPRDASPIFRQISMSNWLWCPAPRLGVGTISIKNSLASVSSFQAWAIMCVFMFMSFCVVMLHRYGGVPGLAGCMGHASLRKARITFE